MLHFAGKISKTAAFTCEA